MKTKSVHALLLLCTVIGFISCRKESAPVSVNVRLLTEQSWNYAEFGIDQNLDGQIDIPENLDNCMLDDKVKFNTNGSGSFDQGSDKCYPEFPDIQTFDWTFHNNETQIEYGGTVHSILTLDEDQLTIYTEENDGSTTVRHLLVYKH
jgi:hypothetical protein